MKLVKTMRWGYAHGHRKTSKTYVFRDYEKNIPIFINTLQKHIRVHPHVYELKKETKPQSSVNKTTILGNGCLEDKKE